MDSAGEGGNSTTCYFSLTALLYSATGDWPQLPHRKRAGNWNKTADKANSLARKSACSQTSLKSAIQFFKMTIFPNFKLTLQRKILSDELKKLLTFRRREPPCWSRSCPAVFNSPSSPQTGTVQKTPKKTNKRPCYHSYCFTFNRFPLN